DPPPMLPQGGVMRVWSRWMPSVQPGDDDTCVLVGLGASGGRVQGPARLLLGPGDFPAMRPGDTLVAPITTPAYTPFFAMAGGVVTDVGGPLSHSSIVAREYGIPAVLGTGSATRRITNGMQVTVDGDRGRVILPGGDASAHESQPASAHRTALALTAAASAAAVLGLAIVRCRRHTR
ncbi:MAG: PEP-utilizing enzyme, partial [Micrococcales bacterium]|nr:PEP-utilizing enzyme [Micrococcales bacterium]